jgi:hypothetical protein
MKELCQEKIIKAFIGVYGQRGAVMIFEKFIEKEQKSKQI